MENLFVEAKCEVCGKTIGYKAHPRVRVRCVEHPSDETRPDRTWA